MNCEKLRPLLPFYVLGDLEKEDGETVDEHVAVCNRCAEEVGALKDLIGQLAKDHITDPGEDFWRGFEASVMERVEELGRERSWSVIESMKKLLFPVPEMRFARTLAYAASIASVAILGSLFAWRAHLHYTSQFEEMASLESPFESISGTDFSYADYIEELTGDELELVSRAVSGWGIEVPPYQRDILLGITDESEYEMYEEIEYMEQEELNLLYEEIEKWERSS